MPLFVMQHFQHIKLITGFGTSWLLQGMSIIPSPQLLFFSLCNLTPGFVGVFLSFSKALVTGRSRT